MSTAVQPGVLSGVGGPIEASRIAWRRARSFNMLSGNRSAFGVLLAPWLWVVELLSVAANARRIRRLDGASVTLHDGRAVRPHLGVLLVAVTALAGYCGAMIVLIQFLVHAMPISDPVTAAAAALLILYGPLLAHLAYLIQRMARTPELRTLNRRRAEIAAQTGRPTVVMSSFVRSSRPGEGHQLLEGLCRDWANTRTIAILNPKNRALADYYIAHGATPDESTWRRLRFESATARARHAGKSTAPRSKEIR